MFCSKLVDAISKDPTVKLYTHYRTFQRAATNIIYNNRIRQLNSFHEYQLESIFKMKTCPLYNSLYARTANAKYTA